MRSSSSPFKGNLVPHGHPTWSLRCIIRDVYKFKGVIILASPVVSSEWYKNLICILQLATERSLTREVLKEFHLERSKRVWDGRHSHVKKSRYVLEDIRSESNRHGFR